VPNHSFSIDSTKEKNYCDIIFFTAFRNKINLFHQPNLYQPDQKVHTGPFKNRSPREGQNAGTCQQMAPRNGRAPHPLPTAAAGTRKPPPRGRSSSSLTLKTPKSLKAELKILKVCFGEKKWYGRIDKIRGLQSP